MKRKLIVTLSAVGIIAFSVVLASFFAGQKEEPKEQKRAVVKKMVEVKKVNYESLKTNVVTYGRVETAQSLDLLSEVSGRMFEGRVRLKAGEKFSKGTLLFYIDDQEASLNLKSQKSNFLRDLAGILPDLKVDFSDNFDAWQKYFSALDIDKKIPELPKSISEKEKTFLATKGIYSTYYTIKSAEVRLEKHKYYAPFSGSVTEVMMQSGSFINPGTKIGRVIRGGLHELKVSVETKDIAWIQRNSPVKIYSEEAQRYWDGQVVRISDYVNQNTQSVDVFIAIETNGDKIYDGQFFQAAIPARTVKDGMIMPRNAIYNGDEVFVVEDSLLKVRQVNIVRLTDENAIFNGLKEGEDLVVIPLIGAYNNMVVEKKDKKDIDLEFKQDDEKKLINADAAQAQAGSNN